MADKSAPRVPLWKGLLSGLLAGGIAIGIGQFVAGLFAPNASPVVVVGQLQIDYTPPALKDFAIRNFGSNDKRVLLAAILVGIAVFSAIVGVLATRRLVFGFIGLGALGTLGVVAVLTRPTSVSLAPTLSAIIAAGIALPLLVSNARTGQIRWPFARFRQNGPPVARPAPAVIGAGGELDRRHFLTAAAAAAGVGVVTGVSGRLLAERFSVAAAQAALRVPRPKTTAPALPPGTDLRIPGLSPFVTPNASFYRVDTALYLPEVTPASWTLRVHGMVDKELSVTFDELIHRPLIEDWITICCVSNPVGGPYIGNARWLGTSLASLLRDAGVRAGADQLLCTSVDGFTSGTPIETVMDGRDALLAIAMNGEALPIEHGFPVRMVVPGLYGYVSATKWVTDIEVTTYAAATAYWSQHGWSQQAPIKTESRIDVPNGQGTLSAGKRAVAGVAWAQHKGIDAVEVRVDRGTWHQATLAAVPGIDTWRQWTWEWEATPGTHVIEARATDATGYTQTAVQAPPPPNGASGYPSVTVVVAQ